MSSGRISAIVATIPLFLTVGCGGTPPPCPEPPKAAPAVRPPLIPPAPAEAKGAKPPTVEEATSFMADVSKQLRALWVGRDRAAWVNETFITEDTEALAAAGEEATAAFVTRAVAEGKRFDGLPLPPELARQFHLLRLAQTIPAPSDPKSRAELAQIESWLTSTYGKGQYCPPKLKGKCLHLDELEQILAKSRSWDELLDAWKGWHTVSVPMRDKYPRYVELGNEGARELGFEDMGALWRSGYDMPPAAFEADVERLWQEVKPLYEELHCYVRSRLQAKYGKDKVPSHGPIPAHLLGNMWAQGWNNIPDVTLPYQGEPSLDVSSKLSKEKYDGVKMTKLAESFFGSLGFDPLPATFWKRSQFSRPRDREVVCHASAWDVTWSDDLRVKVCLEPTEEDLLTIHHELGHNFYYSKYYTLPVLFQAGANDGFHEGIGDTIALSMTPEHLKQIGLLDSVPKSDHAKLNQQMKMALEKVPFLPFGLLIDKWRWDVFSGKTTKEHYNEAWWKLKAEYQGVSSPLARSESDFDPGAKFHVASSTPYMRYFLAVIYQFQFHKALCEASGFKGPLDECSIYGSKAAGEKLGKMLALGASKPWPEAMAAIGGGDKADAAALLEYFAPLRKWLGENTKGMTCGW